MSEDLLPIGTIVKTRDERYPDLMVVGYYPETSYSRSDYLAVPWPIGFVRELACILLDAKDIQSVVSLGYEDEVGKELLAAMQMRVANLNPVLADFDLE